MTVEVDSEKVIKSMNMDPPCLAPFGHIIEDSQSMALYFESISFSHVRRKGNGVGDKLAKIAKFFHAPRIWFHDIPNDVTQLVLSDRSFC